MGVPPLRLEVLTSVSGLEFPTAFRNRVVAEIDGVPVNLVSLSDLKTNKKACGRHKDLADLEQLDEGVRKPGSCGGLRSRRRPLGYSDGSNGREDQRRHSSCDPLDW